MAKKKEVKKDSKKKNATTIYEVATDDKGNIVKIVPKKK